MLLYKNNYSVHGYQSIIFYDKQEKYTLMLVIRYIVTTYRWYCTGNVHCNKDNIY